MRWKMKMETIDSYRFYEKENFDICAFYFETKLFVSNNFMYFITYVYYFRLTFEIYFETLNFHGS